MALSDYIGRRADIVAYFGDDPKKEVLLLADLDQDQQGGQVCVGYKKVAQRFIVKLLTVRGSIPYRPKSGCDFMLGLQRGQYRTSSDVYLAFGAAVALLRREFAAEDTGLPSDEQFRNAKLSKTFFRDSTVVLYIDLTTQAGETAPLILPLNVSV